MHPVLGSDRVAGLFSTGMGGSHRCGERVYRCDSSSGILWHLSPLSVTIYLGGYLPRGLLNRGGKSGRAWAKLLLRRTGEKIEVESQPGKGATFHVTLPLHGAP